jgi:hypothetical protein
VPPFRFAVEHIFLAPTEFHHFISPHILFELNIHHNRQTRSYQGCCHICI